MNIFTGAFGTVREMIAARHEPENLRILAEIYWRTILVISFAGFVAIVAYGLWDYHATVQTLYAAPKTTAQPTPALDREKLDAAVAALEARQSAFTSNLHLDIVADPSK